MIPHSEITFEVQIKTLNGLPPRSVVRSVAKRRWRITLNAGTILEQTAPVCRSADGLVVWNETFTFTTSMEDKFFARLALYRVRRGSNDEKIAEANDLDLVAISQVKEFIVELLDVHSREKSYGRLVVQARVQVPKVEVALAKTTRRQPFVGQICTMTLVPQPWQRFLSAFQQAIEVARRISELDPTAKAAIGAISFALMAVAKQVERDQRVCDLREMMASILLFFRDIGSVQKSPFLRDALEKTLRQVSECTYFILQYQEIESFVQRTAVHLTSDTDRVLTQFFAVFANLKVDLALGSSLQAATNADFILNKVNEIDAFLHLNRLKRLEEAGWHSEKQCPPLVRDFTINHIHRWISSFEPGLFVLAGSPGSGKSAILHSIAGALDKRKRLGAGIFLREDTQGERTAKSLLRTTIYYLGMSNQRLGERIALELSQHPSLDFADAKRYGELLEDISRDLVLYGPLVVIIDGLHELATPLDQDLVETILTKVATSSHHKLRFIISSRDIDTASRLASVCWEIGMPRSGSSADFDGGSVPRDSRVRESITATSPNTGFVDLSDRISLAGYDPQELTPLLSRHSLGSVEWVSLVTEFLDSIPQAARSFLEELLSASSSPRDEKEAIQRASDARQRSIPLSVLDHDLLCAPSGSRLFISETTGLSPLPNKLLHQFGILQVRSDPHIHALQEYDLNVPQSLQGFPGPLLPSSDPPLNIYQIRLHDASEDGQGPVYARIAWPVSVPLVDGKDIKNRFFYLGCGVAKAIFNKMAANSPPEGCEWIILHRKLFESETKDGFTSVMATTPVMTQAILEQLVCIWVDWNNFAGEGTCMRLRDGQKETGFLHWTTFYQVVYHGTHSELSLRGEKRGDLRPGDQLQVRAKYREDFRAESKYAVIAMALTY